MSNIEQLLKRQFEGTISPEEEKLLDHLTHRSEVLDKAQQRAHVLRRRQWVRAGSLCSIIVATSLIVSTLRSTSSMMAEGPVVANASAQNIQDSAIIETLISEENASDLASAVTPAHPQKLQIAHQDHYSSPETSTKAEVADEIIPESIPISDETVVACNTQCSPDSVISDIWKFLHA